MNPFSSTEVFVMMTLACGDIDSSSNCPFVARAETEEALFTDTAKHAKDVHGYTDEQLNDPELHKKMRSLIKNE
jgi:predicted small metal-binding protein